MHLDVQTLSVVTVFVTALLGALLVFAGLQNRSIRAPMWWGAAHIVARKWPWPFDLAAAPCPISSADLANALVLLSYGLTWTGARRFRRPQDQAAARRASRRRSGFGLCRIPALAHDADMRVVVVSTMMATLALLHGGGILARA